MKPDPLEWHSGPPPHVGWWYTFGGWRWWNGKEWSQPAYPDESKVAVGLAAAIPASDFIASIIVWCYHWPARARVERVNPETGEVTGARS
jgi:hypothetical protein